MSNEFKFTITIKINSASLSTAKNAIEDALDSHGLSFSIDDVGGGPVYRILCDIPDPEEGPEIKAGQLVRLTWDWEDGTASVVTMHPHDFAGEMRHSAVSHLTKKFLRPSEAKEDECEVLYIRPVDPAHRDPEETGGWEPVVIDLNSDAHCALISVRYRLGARHIELPAGVYEISDKRSEP